MGRFPQPLTDDCFVHDGIPLELDEALARLRDVFRPVAEIESVPLAAATGRVLAVALAAPIGVPGHDNSAVDGYALAHAALDPAAPTRLRVAGRAAAGHPWTAPTPSGAAIRIFTGAAMPAGLDTVAMEEDCRVDDGFVTVPPGLTRGANRRFAGEDVARDAIALAAGTRLRPQEIGMAAALGFLELPVRRRLRVAVFSTGDELAEAGVPLAPGRVYDSNRPTLVALLAGLGAEVTDMGILPDRAETVRARLEQAAATHDALVTSGGVSGGEEDHVRGATAALGRLFWWRLAIKPGRPVAVGQIGAAALLGLPGNPSAAMTTFFLVARPVLQQIAGATLRPPMRLAVRSAFARRKKTGRIEYVRVRLEAGPDGAVAHAFPREGAGMLSSMVWSDGLAELPGDLDRVEIGDWLAYLPFTEFA